MTAKQAVIHCQLVYCYLQHDPDLALDEANKAVEADSKNEEVCNNDYLIWLKVIQPYVLVKLCTEVEVTNQLQIWQTNRRMRGFVVYLYLLRSWA